MLTYAGKDLRSAMMEWSSSSEEEEEEEGQEEDEGPLDLEVTRPTNACKETYACMYKELY